MSIRPLLTLCVVASLSGCLYHARERTDGTVANLVSHPYDVMPPSASAAVATPPPAPSTDAPAATPNTPAPVLPTATPKNGGASGTAPADSPSNSSAKVDVQTSKYLLASYEEGMFQPPVKKFEPRIPADLPGSEAKAIEIPKGEAEKERAINQIYPKLPPLPPEPAALPSPEGRPYTLADLQFIAAGNSPELRQAASDVEAARGNLIQARTYPNPTTGWEITPSNDGTVASTDGVFIDQVVKTGGKLKLASAAAEMDLQNSQLALRRARSDLATRVRQAYYALLVARETMHINRALAKFSDDVFYMHTELLKAGNPAAYEPMALRAQSYSVRFAYDQSIQNYLMAWKQLVATIGQRQLPLTQVEGRIDAVIPYFDYDTVLGYVLRNHTDVLIARNVLEKAKYQLKLAQVTPVPDVEFNVALLKDFTVQPKGLTPTATVSFPIPIWDQNKGNIMAAEAGLVRATEESHRVELALTNLLSSNYGSYKTSLQALDYFRNHILPDQVRFYRGVLERRQLDPNAAFSDLFTAQQTLAGFVTTYVGALNTLWSSSVSVADMLQTDDLFQLAEPQAVPSLPDLGVLLPFPCCHPSAGGSAAPPVAPALYQSAANAPRTLSAPQAFVAMTPAKPMPAAAPKPVQSGHSANMRSLANPSEADGVATFGANTAGDVAVPNAAANAVVTACAEFPEKPPADKQSVEKSIQPLTFETPASK